MDKYIERDYKHTIEVICKSHFGKKAFGLFSKYEQDEIIADFFWCEQRRIKYFSELFSNNFNVFRQRLLHIIDDDQLGSFIYNYQRNGDHIIEIRKAVNEQNRALRKIQDEAIHAADDPNYDPKCDPDTPEFDDDLERASSARMGV